MSRYLVGETVTWLGQPRGEYRIEAIVECVTAKRVKIRVLRPDAKVPTTKLVAPESLRAGFKGPEVRW